MIRVVILLTVMVAAVVLPRHTVCSTFVSDFIVNGTDVPAGKYPFMVSYLWLGKHKCGGTILNENWVLTSAQCTEGDIPEYVKILAGTERLILGGTRHPAVQLIQHENYDSNLRINDIALVKVRLPFVWDDVIQPVTLPYQYQETPEDSNATVIGWGYPYTGGSTMNNLQEVEYWIVTDEECMDVHTYEVYPTNICAYFPDGGSGDCNGDTGGPLLVDDYQAGIVSWSEKPCAVAPYPGVFTEVSAYIDWINSHIN